jgi:hypothetical protein
VLQRGYSGSLRLEHGLFGHPETIKLTGMTGGGPSLDRFVFRLSVKPFGKLERLKIAAHLLQIDPDILSLRNGNKHSAMRMRQVEAQNMRTTLLVQQGRFARWPWLEPERCRLDPQIPGKHNA